MPRKYKPRRKGQGTNWVIGELRKIAKHPSATIAQRLKAVFALAVIDGILDVPLNDPSSALGVPDIVDVEAKADENAKKMVEEHEQRMKKRAEELKNGISHSNEGNG